jgi:isocitrate dehydrogenase (NAD+)
MHATDGVFLEAGRTAAAEIGELDVDDRLVDAICHELVRRPAELDVLFSPVMYGDILSDLCAGITGGLGLAPGASYGADCAVFEAVHGTANAYVGTGRANPIATILSGAMLLRHLGERSAADRIEAAVARVIADGRTVTGDLLPGRTPGASTDAVVAAVAERLG